MPRRRRPAKRSSAASSPTISSLPALKPRPEAVVRDALAAPARSTRSGGVQVSGDTSMSSCWTSAAPTRSRRPARMPEACGPPIALPPEKATRSAPRSMKLRRLDFGGSCAAASTITGTVARSAYRDDRREVAAFAGLAEKANAAVRGVIAASISQGSMPRTPAPVPRSLWPMSMMRAPDGAQRVGVAGVMRARQQDLVGEAVGVRQRRHSRDIPARHACRGGERERGGSAGRDDAGLRAGMARDRAARRRLQLADIDRSARRVRHRGDHRLVHQRAAQARERPGGVDAALHAERGVDVLGHRSGEDNKPWIRSSFELFKNAIFSIADEMALTVFRTTYSGVLKDNMDYSTGFADAEGKLVAQGLTLPGHLGSVPTAMQSIMRHYRRRHAAGRCVHHERPVRRRHAPAGHLRVQAAVPRGRARSRSRARCATTPTSAAGSRARTPRTRPRSMPRGCASRRSSCTRRACSTRRS